MYLVVALKRGIEVVGIEDAKRYIKHGFIKEKYENVYLNKSPEEINTILNSLSFDNIASQSMMEYDEEARGVWQYTNFPMPEKRYRIDYERYDQSIEETYFWILNF